MDKKTLVEMLAEKNSDYKVVCGACGLKFVRQPEICLSCGNDAEFEPIA